ncbi:MAG: YggS family pyridoxal phosphate-dependent enzyme [Bacillota bacterium]|nr:YggS family pyridoxal phosphate-dependent enzyme [Bacillota bacterium]
MQEKLYIDKACENIKNNYFEIIDNIQKTAKQCGRSPDEITFLAATKTVSAELINYAISLGLSFIGENKVQEFLSKYDDYDKENAELHFIGHLQTNKVRQIVGKVEMIHSVDSFKLANEISTQSIAQGIKTDILIEVNIGREESKSGVMEENLQELLLQIKDLQGIKVRGLMTIPPICERKEEICKYFSKMNQLFIDIRDKRIDNICMDFLSMGMSDDYVEAILNGSNLVRIGSALFGARDYR